MSTAMGYKESSPVVSLAAIVEPIPVVAVTVVFTVFLKRRTEIK